MKRIPPNTQRQEALCQDLIAGFAGHPLRQFVRRAAELLLQVGLEDVVTSILGRGHYERAEGEATGYRNGYGQHTLKTEAGPLSGPQGPGHPDPGVDRVARRAAPDDPRTRGADPPGECPGALHP